MQPILSYFFSFFIHIVGFNDAENKRATRIFLGDRAEARLGNLPSTTVMELLEEATKRQLDGIGGRLPLVQRQSILHANNLHALDDNDEFVPVTVAVPVSPAFTVAESTFDATAPAGVVLPVVEAVAVEDDWTVL